MVKFDCSNSHGHWLSGNVVGAVSRPAMKCAL